MKKVITILAIVGIVAAIVFTLKNNKAKAEKATTVVGVDVQEIPVTVAKAMLQKVENNLSMVGTVQPASDVNIVSETSGRILKLYAAVGDTKTAGSVIAEVDDELKQAAVLNAQAAFDKAKADLDRMEALYREKAGTPSQLDQARYGLKAAEAQLIIAKRQLRDTKITAPITGIITSRLVDAGATIGNNAVIGNMVDISQLKVKFNLAEKDAFALKPGDKVTITTDVYPGINYSGIVKSIAAKGDEAHTYPVEISLPNSAKNPLKAGMFTRVQFNTIQRGESIVIPRAALLGGVKNPQVFVANGNKAVLRQIVAGADAGQSIEVLGGLQPGETVIVSGQTNLKDQASIRIMN
jgi:RND family efflux transporter MFP subunit